MKYPSKGSYNVIDNIKWSILSYWMGHFYRISPIEENMTPELTFVTFDSLGLKRKLDQMSQGDVD